MNKINYILATLLLGCSTVIYAQQSNATSDTQLPDTLPIGFQLLVPSKLNSYSVSGVNSKAFEKSPTVDISKALYGKIAGLNVYQGSGASPDNISTLSLHGQSPLILVDGFPREINDITSLEIESCHILKDAASTALYGMRGANGILIITTKRGHNAKLKVNVEYNLGINTQFRSPRFAEAYTYAQFLNTALFGDRLPARYNSEEVEAFKTGSYPYEYPNVNWWKQTLNKNGFTHNLKFSFDGGNEKFRYFTVIDYYRDRSMMKENTKDNRYNTKPTDTRLALRTNIDVNISANTYLKVGLVGKLQETNGTRYGTMPLFSSIYNTPAAAFPVRYENGIYGGSEIYGAANPVALLQNYGHMRNIYGTLLADLSLRQELNSIAKGLFTEASVSFDNIGNMQESTSKEYRYMNTQAEITYDGTLKTSPKIWGKDSETLEHRQPFGSLLMRSNFQAKVAYNRTFGYHQVSGAVIYDMQSTVKDGRNKTQKNQSFIANASYSYSDRYVVNGVFNYSGSAYLPENKKFHSYPAVSAAWIISNESFMKTMRPVNLLKVRVSYGLSGWDGSLSHELWRQSYVGGGSYVFGNINEAWGSKEGSMPVMGLTSEKAEKTTLGIDFAAFDNRLNASFEGYYEKRSDILVSGSASTSGIIGIDVGMVNEGVYKYKGFDASLSWSDKIANFSYRVETNISYLNTEVVNDNQPYQEYDYLYSKGNRLGQIYGLEAIGFFNSQMEINNSPLQTFSQVAPGDVKYKDQNGDNRIDEKDVVKMFGSSIPRFYYGFNVDLTYKKISITADFQGIAGKTISLLNSPLYMPLINNSNISENLLEKEKFWTPENKAEATMPKLTTQQNLNNYRNSSLWYRDGSFLKLRNLVIAYTFPRTQTRFADVKVFLQGTNLFSADNIHFADPEQLHITYPSIRSYWTGVKLNF